MQLTSENYYSQEANKEYMSVSGYKDFAGTYGKMPCEFYGMEKLNGRWEDEKSTALLVGSYVDSYFEGSLDQFKKDNPEIFTQKGELKSNFKQSRLEVFVQALDLVTYTLRITKNEKIFLPEYQRQVTDDIIETAKSIYIDASLHCFGYGRKRADICNAFGEYTEKRSDRI